MTYNEHFNILFVCTANLCRSQLAELRFRQMLPTHSSIKVASAGTRAVEGARIPEKFRRVFEGFCIDEAVSSRLSSRLLTQADLVLTMTRGQRSEVVQVLPESVNRTYTLPQFVNLAEQAVHLESALSAAIRSGDRWRVIDAVNSLRGTSRGRRGAVEIPDPERGSSWRVTAVSKQITAFLDRLATILEASATGERTVQLTAPGECQVSNVA